MSDWDWDEWADSWDGLDSWGGSGVSDSNNKWKQVSGPMNSRKTNEEPKFKVGDRVRKSNAVVERTGKIVESHGKNSSGIFEYTVEFGAGINNLNYCYEHELSKVHFVKPECECGAAKTYGARVTSLHHAFYCPMRGMK